MARFRLRPKCLTLVLGLIVSRHVNAQPAITRPASGASAQPRITIVDIKLLTSPDGGGLHTQEWSKRMEPLDVTIQIQRPTLNDKPEVKERTVGTIRYVTAIGTLDRAGKISFPGHSFSLSDGPRLSEWITELKTYGAQGTTEGQPLWGLTRDQFSKVYDSLLQPVEAELIGLSPSAAIAKLPLPRQYPVRISQSALTAADRGRVRQDVRGFSAATALAILLNDCGLGFRPNRTPANGLELLVEPLGQRQDLWPIGWPLKQQRIKAAPKLFAMTPIELNQVQLADLLPTVSELTETPVVIDHYEIDQKKIDLTKTIVSFKRAETSWSVALRTMVVARKLSREIWQDEAGRAFVLITTNRPGRSGATTE